MTAARGPKYQRFKITPVIKGYSMTDMLVKILNLPDVHTMIEEQKKNGIDIRRPLAPEEHRLVTWVRKIFGDAWADECEVAFSNKPVSCFIATNEGEVIGFACYDATCKNFFGPVGVIESYRGKGIGKVLLLSCLHAMAEEGYAYAIIAYADKDNSEFYSKTTGAKVIEGSTPGIYRGVLWY